MRQTHWLRVSVSASCGIQATCSPHKTQHNQIPVQLLTWRRNVVKGGRVVNKSLNWCLITGGVSTWNLFPAFISLTAESSVTQVFIPVSVTVNPSEADIWWKSSCCLQMQMNFKTRQITAESLRSRFSESNNAERVLTCTETKRTERDLQWKRLSLCYNNTQKLSLDQRIKTTFWWKNYRKNLKVSFFECVVKDLLILTRQKNTGLKNYLPKLQFL